MIPKKIKMAAYRSGDFLTAEELECFFADDDDIMTLEDTEDIADTYCICRGAETEEMIMCEGKDCAVSWFHYECVGITPETVPAGKWLCDSCRGTKGRNKKRSRSTTTRPRPTAGVLHVVQQAQGDNATSQAPPVMPKTLNTAKQKETTAATDTRPSNSDTTTDEVKKSRNTKRIIISEYKEEDVKEDALNIFQEALSTTATKLPMVYKDIHSLHSSSMADEAKAAVQHLVLAMWKELGLSSSTPHHSFDPHIAKFHRFRQNPENDKLFKTIVTDHSSISERNLVFIKQMLYQGLLLEILKRTNAGFPSKLVEKEPAQKLTSTEEQILRYASGYVCCKLFRYFTRHSEKNKSAAACASIVGSWNETGNKDTGENFLTYTKKMLDVKDRGGLCHIDDDLYILFRRMELVASPVLCASNMKNLQNTNVHQKLVAEIEKNELVKIGFATVTKKVNDDRLKHVLFRKLVANWVNLRCRAFISAYTYALRTKEATVSTKAEKPLRKKLKENCKV